MIASRMDSLEHGPATSNLHSEDMAITQEAPNPTAHNLSTLSKKSKRCIERLLAHQAADALDLSGIHHKRQAAVLILLYEKDGDLRVLLTTRSKTLRAHPGQTALPGGKMDDTDRDAIETAYREANEEIGLPMNSPHVHTLCVLRQFISASKLLVTPVVALLTDLDILNTLTPSEGEVDVIFDHPLEAILDPSLSVQEKLVDLNSELWPYDAEFYNFSDNSIQWLGNSSYRMHRFRSSASAIKGLTAEILIATAIIAYDRSPSYLRFAPDQLTTIKEIIRAVGPASFSDMPKAVATIDQSA